MSYNYVEMNYSVGSEGRFKIPENVRFDDINKESQTNIYNLFIDCFNQGDAQFYKNLKPDNRKQFYQDELGFPNVLSHKGSHCLYFNDELIGFTYVVEYAEKNADFSCMCIKPKYQGQGFCRLMMEYVEDVARRDKLTSMTLGTEDTMKAYQLYKKYGFKSVTKHKVE